MYRIAIVEDIQESREQLKHYLDQFQQEHDVQLQYRMFHDGASFIREYDAGYDVILMDIEMPNLNGMDAARKLRLVDEDVCLIFVTEMAKYAVESYEVRALDYILKPWLRGLIALATIIIALCAMTAAKNLSFRKRPVYKSAFLKLYGSFSFSI